MDNPANQMDLSLSQEHYNAALVVMYDISTPSWQYEVANNSHDVTKHGSQPIEYHWPVLLMFLVVLGAICGNLLVCLAVFHESKLRNMFNYFLVSLAMSDLLCAVLVMPITIVKAFISELEVPKQLCQAWYALDVLFTSSTIMHLTVISIDRYMALKFPLRYGAARRTRHTFFKILLVWILAFSLAGPLFYGSMFISNSKNKEEEMTFKGCGPENASFILPAVVISFFLPLLIMGTMYVLTVLTLHKQAKHQARLQLRKVVTYRREDSYYSLTATTEAPPASPGAQGPSKSQNSHSTYTADTRYQSTSNGKVNAASSNLQIPLLHKGVVNNTNSPQQTTVYDSSLCDGTKPLKQMLVLSSTSESNTYSKVLTPQSRGLKSLQNMRSSKPLKRRTSNTSGTCSNVSESDSNTMDEESTPNQSPVHSNGSHKPPGMNPKPSFTQRIKQTISIRQQSNVPKIRCRRAYSQDRGRKAVKVLGVLFVVFVVCYLPFFLTYTISGMCAGKCAHGISPAMIQAFEWLGYSGSMINPIVYHVFSKEFRVVFYRLLRCSCCFKRARRGHT